VGIALRRRADAPYMRRRKYRPLCESLSMENALVGWRLSRVRRAAHKHKKAGRLVPGLYSTIGCGGQI
jgi:hypothetical protein